jgi:exosortase
MTGTQAATDVTDWRKAVLPICVLVFLWFRLIDHLRIEWSVNPQYSYGYAVPFLCAYLLWRGWSRGAEREDEGWRMEDGERSPRSPLPRPPSAILHPPSSILYPLLLVCALAYAPTRLIQEANPEWRLVSWALALETIGITLLLLRLTPTPPQASLFTFHFSLFTFPLFFFLVAVPWPTTIEGPLIQGLTRANVGSTVELLGLLGVPAIQHGNVIEVGTGVVGIDEACSGIRSFQATLMIGLFFGELYRLSLLQRVGLCIAGFSLSFVFNVIRTTLLTWVAAHKGTAAIAQWHDPAGVTILLACFIALWLLALFLAKNSQLKTQNSQLSAAPTPSSLIPHPSSFILPVLAAWLLCVEVGTEYWYRSHEARLPQTTAWQVTLPRENPTFRDVPFSEKARRFLRFDEGQNGAWEDDQRRRWQAIFLRWNPGRIASHLASFHTPEVCLTAAGRELLSQSDLHTVLVKGLPLPFRSYVAALDRNDDFPTGSGDAAAPLRVFYCLWDDRANEQSFGTELPTYANRFAPVLAGRRNSGQRSLEVAVWGIGDAAAADVALQHELEKLVQK